LLNDQRGCHSGTDCSERAGDLAGLSAGHGETETETDPD